MTRRRWTVAMLAFAVLGFSIGQTAFIPAVAGLARSLDVSTAAAGWVVTAPLVSSAVLTPVLGRLGDMFGRRRVFVLILASVCLGSILSAVATNLPGILVGRVLYGAGAGLFPVGFGILRDVLPAERRGQAIGFLSALAGLGGGLGPAVGGALVELDSYTAIFWGGAVVALVPAAAAPFLVSRRSDRRQESVDWRGVLLLAAGLTAPLVAITNSVRWGWLDLRTGGLALGGLAVLAYFVRFERRLVAPLLDMGIVLQRRVAFANTASVLVGYASYSGFMLIALLAQVPSGASYGLGLGPAGAGLLMAPGCLAMVLMGALSGRLRHRVQARTVLAIGGVAAAGGLVTIALSPGSRVDVAIAAALLLGGVGLAIASMSNLVIDAVPSGQTSEATGVNTVARVVGAALGSQVAVTILAAGTHGESAPSQRAFVFAFLVSAVFALSASAVGFGIKPRPFDKNYADD